MSAGDHENLNSSGIIYTLDVARRVLLMISIYRRVQRLAEVALAVVSVTLLSTAQAARIPAGLYYLETIRTGTSFNFSNDPIPSGFFGPGSDVFIGFFRLRGIPFHETTADTVVRRLSDFNYYPE
jgi:hypothetical protein